MEILRRDDNPLHIEQIVRTHLEAVFNRPELPNLHIPDKRKNYRVTPGTPFHAFPEIFFQLSGINRFTCGPDNHDLQAGEICIMPAAVPHVETTLSNEFSAFVFVHDRSRILLLIMESQLGQRPWGYPILTYRLDNAQMMADLLSETANSFLKQSPTAEHLFRAYIGLLLDRINQPRTEEGRAYSPLVTKCIDIFFAEMGSEDLTLNAVAERLNCNADSLSARFSKEVGQSAIQYLTGLRIEQARGLLTKTSMTISEVSWACGYRDPNYFSRLFKSQTGHTPRNFRKHTVQPVSLI